MNSKVKEAIKELKMYEIILSAFSRLYISPPDNELIEFLKNKELRKIFFNLFSGFCEDFFNIIDDVQDEKFPLELLQIEFTKLFTLPGEFSIKLYESYYEDKWIIPISVNKYFPNNSSEFKYKNLLFGETAVSLNKIYLKEGVKINEGAKELPDHLSIELNFLRILFQKQIESFQANNSEDARNFAKKIVRFVEDHLNFLIDKINLQFKARNLDGLYSKGINILSKLIEVVKNQEKEIIKNLK